MEVPFVSKVNHRETRYGTAPYVEAYVLSIRLRASELLEEIAEAVEEAQTLQVPGRAKVDFFSMWCPSSYIWGFHSHGGTPKMVGL